MAEPYPQFYSSVVPKPVPASQSSKNNHQSRFPKEFYLLLGVVGGVFLTILLITVLSTVPLKLVGLWFASIVFFFIMRYPDMWKMGVELFFLFTFIYAYSFNLWFVLSIVYISFYGVMRVRPDEVNGALVHVVVLTGMAITARQFAKIYGVGILPGEFVFAMLVSLFIWLVVDTILARKTAPVPLPKLFITHSLQILISYYSVNLFGFRVLEYFLKF